MDKAKANKSKDNYAKSENDCPPDQDLEQKTETMLEDDALDEAKDEMDHLTEMEGRFKELEDKYLRLAAEYDNFRRRTRKEKEALYSDSITDVVCGFLPVADNIDRALSQLPEEMSAEMKSFYEGVHLIRKQFDEVLLAFGVEEIKALGEGFDPNYHNAVSHIQDDRFGEQEITEVFERGYKRADRVLRYTIVQVAN